MKKFLSLFLVVLMMLIVLFVSVSCKEAEESVPDRSASWDEKTKAEHCDPILPTGTGQTIPTNWSVDAKGLTGLPAIRYNFPGYDSASKTYSPVSETNVTAALVDAVKNTPQSFFDETPKNIIFLFSDGWGVTEVNMSREYKGELILDYLPYATESKTDAYKQFSYTDSSVATNYTSHSTTDSCAGGTQVLAGYKTRYGYIALDVDANPVTNLIEAAHSKGWKTANVTNDNIVDATPASAMIHDTNRYHSDVLYYKALAYALIDQNLDLLMGWDWGMGTFFTGSTGTWAERLLDAEKDGITDFFKRSENKDIKTAKPYDGNSDPNTWFKNLGSVQYKARVAGFLVYYHIWEVVADKLNSCQTWTSTGSADLAAFEAWLDSPTGLTAAIAAIEAKYGDPADSVVRNTTFKAVLANKDANGNVNTDFAKPVLGSWTSDGNDYNTSKPNRGYAMYSTIAKNYPSWPEMVAYTLYQMDAEADAADTGFFCIIENTCTDGWGHSEDDYKNKVVGMLNEVQCFDEGVAIAVKYVLEHPDTLLVISADHETGGFQLREGWEDDISKIKSTTTGHSSQRVPLYAFGAGAQNFSAEAINTKYGAQTNAGVEQNGKVHEGWITGAIMGELITGEAFGLTGNITYKGEAFTMGSDDEPYGNPLWDPAINN